MARNVPKSPSSKRRRSPAARTKNIVTLDNGGRPFRIALNTQSKTFSVFTASGRKVVPKTKYQKFFPLKNQFGHKSNTWPAVFGAVFLLSEQGTRLKYMYICENVYTWSLPKTNPLTHVFGEIGNSAVPYQLGLTKQRSLIYFNFAPKLVTAKLPTISLPSDSTCTTNSYKSHCNSSQRPLAISVTKL